jgi:membrane protease YdiL (CAAX protease family)
VRTRLTLQLGWSVSLVLTLTAVGIIFTYVRARTGSVFASYLLHLGYNSTIAVATIIGFLGTKGFTRMPPGH